MVGKMLEKAVCQARDILKTVFNTIAAGLWGRCFVLCFWSQLGAIFCLAKAGRF